MNILARSRGLLVLVLQGKKSMKDLVSKSHNGQHLVGHYKEYTTPAHARCTETHANKVAVGQHYPLTST